MNHTPTPIDPILPSLDTCLRAVGIKGEANAYIVTACNAHEELVVALEEIAALGGPSDDHAKVIAQRALKALAKAGVKS